MERASDLAAHALASLALGNTENQAEISRLLVDLMLSAKSLQTQQHAAGAAWRVMRENPSDELVIAKAGGTAPLVHLLRDSELPNAKAYALLSLSLSIDEKSQKIVVDEGGVEPLVQMLLASNLELCEQAACAIQKLLRKNTDTQIQLANAETTGPLIKMLDRSSSDRSREFAAAALSELAHIDSGKVAIDQLGGIQPLVDLLSDEAQADSMQYVAATLARLADDAHERREMERQELVKQEEANAQDNLAAGVKSSSSAKTQLPDGKTTTVNPLKTFGKKKGTTRMGLFKNLISKSTELPPTKAELIGRAGAIQPLVKLLDGECGVQAQQEAAGALAALAVDGSNRAAIADAGGIGPLVMLLGLSNTRSREHAAKALVRLSVDVATRPIICEKLVSMLDDSRGKEWQEQGAAAIANLARESAENRESILKADGIPRLLHLLGSNSREAKENSANAISFLAYKSRDNQNAIARADGIPRLVASFASAAANVKEVANLKLCTLVAACIWHVADGNYENKTLLTNEGAIVPIIGVMTNPNPELQTKCDSGYSAHAIRTTARCPHASSLTPYLQVTKSNRICSASGALAALARDHPDNQAVIAKTGAIPPLCTIVKDGSAEAKEESAAALWALAADNAVNKASIAKLGGIEPLLTLLMYGTSDKSSVNAAGSLTALAAQHAENRLSITRKMIAMLGSKPMPARALRLLSAVATLCDNEPTNQVGSSNCLCRCFAPLVARSARIMPLSLPSGALAGGTCEVRWFRSSHFVVRE